MTSLNSEGTAYLSAIEAPSEGEVVKPHLWGVQYSDNNRVDAHNVFLTKGAAMSRAMEAAIPAKVVPLYTHPSPAAPSEVTPDSNGHRTRSSDSSFYDEVCTLCGATDGRGDNSLDRPCPKRLIGD